MELCHLATVEGEYTLAGLNQFGINFTNFYKFICHIVFQLSFGKDLLSQAILTLGYKAMALSMVYMGEAIRDDIKILGQQYTG